ncbi:MAG: 4-hydroxythreonine-4-phosphate dehydrogenase PdxA, partial [Gammaproteobacteria bacterium]|nr:4-hydroxythreonine-4-phosphate dehydrogenase PdxA [Gammaproteobacteria bacterium]
MLKSAIDKDSKLLVTTGEPSGIGPDILLKYASANPVTDIIALGDPDLLAARAQILDLEIAIHPVSKTDVTSRHTVTEGLNVLPVALNVPSRPGYPDSRNAGYVLNCLSLALDLCMEKATAGIVTGPIQKSTINEAGIPFTGHTEWFAEQTGTGKVVMMLATDQMRVALATTHLPLREVSDAISHESLLTTLRIIHRELQSKFAITEPHILVCGLNPHAGENGYLGSEDKEIIAPVIDQLRQEAMNITGPLPADTAFTPKYLDQCDIVLAMYHDQGLPVLKHSGFGAAANITLGLPVIRTSVDHGTALSLAGTGEADAGSLAYAIDVARQMVTASRIKASGISETM